MKNIFVALLIFIFVMCFFFISPLASQAIKTDKSFIDLGPGVTLIASLQQNDGIVLMAQTPFSISLNIFYKNDLLCEATYASTQTAFNYDKAEVQALGITVYKTTKPWRSFHAGK